MKSKKIKIVLLTTVLAQNLYSSVSGKHRYPVPYTTPEIVLELYQLMKDIDELFTAHDISYWIDGGTLLGALNYGGIIPWDDDIDLCIDKNQEKKLLSLKPYLAQLDYSIKKMFWGYKIQAKNSDLDIFFMTEIGNVYTFAKEKYRKLWKRNNRPIHYTHEELFPLKQYQFGQLLVWGANNPYPYLDNSYPNWETLAKFQVDHNNHTFHETTITLTEEDKVPAQPLGPLKHRVLSLLK